MGLKFLLIMHYLIREILVEMVLDIYVKGIKIKIKMRIFYHKDLGLLWTKIY
jgi:hypothetical protein